MLIPVYKNRWRRPAFTLSTLLHASFFYLLVFSPSATAVARRRPSPRHKYSVLVLRLEDYRPHRTPAPQTDHGGGNRLPAAGKGTSASDVQTPSTDPLLSPNPSLASSDSLPETHHRPFVLSPVPHRNPVTQTLVQFDVPPELQIRVDIPLPTAVLWDQLPAVRRKFVAPVARQKTQPVAEMPMAPELSAPNRETVIGDLKLASLIANQNARLVHAPAKTAPLKGAGTQPVPAPPQIAVIDPADGGLTALISLPDSPVVSAQTVALPPANQISPFGSGGQGTSGSNPKSTTGNSGSGIQGGSRGAGNVAAQTGAQNAGSGSGSPGLHGAPSPNPGFGGTALASSGAGSGAAGTGGDSQGQLDLPLPGATRFLLPKDGKFGVVVSGSSVASPYVESIGALSGKMVYSVFISVGLRKKWILEYCLPKAEEQKNAVKGHADPVQAPWPYVIERPDNFGASSHDYVMVHGILTTEGRFDQLALIFPAELDRKDLLMSSLKRWTFRPASRDGVPSEIEILLIIPTQTE